jgi:hypothetical protein
MAESTHDLTYHESFCVSVYPTTFAPCFPDCGFYESNSEFAEVCLDLERSVQCHFVAFLAGWYHHGIHQCHQIFGGFGLYLPLVVDF